MPLRDLQVVNRDICGCFRLDMEVKTVVVVISFDLELKGILTIYSVSQQK